ncbi:flagellar biosynthetic protein FliO [Geminicoccaceae bacterium 1502E]|nr:flagellar biosynthetic protein FliO [Geminicoccaceae bacterium 1502E]
MDLVDPLRLLAAALVVAGLAALFLLLARRLERLRAGGSGNGRRLAVLETCWLDSRTRLLLVRCDRAEHLVLVGQAGAQALAPPPTPASPEGRP